MSNLPYPTTIKFYHDDPNLTVRFVKNIVPLFSNIKEFEVYRDEKQSPYIDEESNKVYRFVLKDDKDNELWLNTICGYSGTGPYSTQKILNIFGLKNDYKIEEKSYISESNLTPIHQINLLISKCEKDRFNDKENTNHYFWLNANFTYASQLYNTRKLLESFGYFTPAKSYAQFYDIEIPFNLQKFDKHDNYADFTINNVFFFNNELNDLPISTLETILKEIIQNNGGSVEILRL
ncbi:hypothetical protein [Anaeromicrobium sediminis]|uniref:Uncharacterized protein n=1 Tax=Anaeromicrobium sediminis TaxID=1478221 RepID=A0A267MQ32_9FIRM|nr:hypothetical protein [Anaeromicrobium sediminis]PAB60883.1 hypothetical protein CCE28_00165 [Anaeromicrobium sediminis]